MTTMYQPSQETPSACNLKLSWQAQVCPATLSTHFCLHVLCVLHSFSSEKSIPQKLTGVIKFVYL